MYKGIIYLSYKNIIWITCKNKHFFCQIIINVVVQLTIEQISFRIVLFATMTDLFDQCVVAKLNYLLLCEYFSHQCHFIQEV